MVIGKSIRVYLADATVTGIRYAELVNWTGHAIACPRYRLPELTKWPEAGKQGIYFLFESRFWETKPKAYIGESENVSQRLISHDRNKEFWNEAVIFTSKDENLTKAHIKYLEASLVNLSKKAGRYALVNGNTPPESSLPRADRDAMEEFIVNLRMVLGILGYPILEPIFESKHDNNSSKLSENQISSVNILNNLVFKVNHLTAYGAVTDEGFVLKKGSQLSKANSVSVPRKLISIKEQLLVDGELIDDKDNLISTQDILFSSSSYAAAIVAGTSRSGPQAWKASNGETLKQLEDELIAGKDNIV